MDLWQAAAADNARWCDLIARSHGLPTHADPQAWTCQTRTPPFYPDAVTLVRCPPVQDLLSRVDASPGCSVKDSFGTLDLRPSGFHVLFEAEWIIRPPAGRMKTFGSRWRRITGPAGLARWQDAWRPDGGPSDLFKASILDHDWVAVLAAGPDDQIVAGAIVTRGRTVASISNFFARPGAGPEAWPGCMAMTSSLFPGRLLGGYESGDDLARAEQHGFKRIGHLRIWSNDPNPAP